VRGKIAQPLLFLVSRKFRARFLNARFLPLGRPRTSILETLRSQEESRNVENLAVITLSILI
jgi:hypothetical protein